MFCPQCGTRNEESAAHCVQCGTMLVPAGDVPMAPPFEQPQSGQPHFEQSQFGQTPGVAPPPMLGAHPPFQGLPQQPYVAQPVTGEAVPSYMVQSLLMTFCCCTPLGIWGIFKANKVKKLLAMGDVAGATKISNESKTILWIGLGLGLLFGLIRILGTAINLRPAH